MRKTAKRVWIQTLTEYNAISECARAIASSFTNRNANIYSAIHFKIPITFTRCNHNFSDLLILIAFDASQQCTESPANERHGNNTAKHKRVFFSFGNSNNLFTFFGRQFSLSFAVRCSLFDLATLYWHRFRCYFCMALVFTQWPFGGKKSGRLNHWLFSFD